MSRIRWKACQRRLELQTKLLVFYRNMAAGSLKINFNLCRLVKSWHWLSLAMSNITLLFQKITFLLFVIYAEDVGIDGDDPEHIQWIYNKALERAANFGIQGLSYRLTQGILSLVSI